MRQFSPSGDQRSNGMHYIEEDMSMSSEPEPYLPPPHIAARIYKTKDRLKSSAASSRRNSINSSRSARSGHGPSGSHVAQHLRRASLLESRKAKAANRQAHAEEVRSRAAMLRSAPRLATSREDRALAAQQARERYLAQVKANCAEEVQRSKRVAAQQREKRARENIKLKESIDARYIEAEKRKNMLQQSQRRLKTATASTDKKSNYVWKPKNSEQAARIIQRAWRNRQWARAVHEFSELDLNLDAIQKAPFEEVAERLNEERLLSCTSRLLRHFGLENDKGRTFLSIFLILGHPTHLFNQNGDQEQNLVNKARELLAEFNRMLNSPYPTTLVSTFSEYEEAFAAWRSHDSARMISTMTAQFVELDAIWQTVKNDTEGGVAEDYKTGIQDNQAMILAKLKRFTGPEKAMKMIRDAVRASRKAKSKKKAEAKVDKKPRVVSDSSSAASASEKNLTDIIHSSNAPTSTRSQLESSSLIPHNRIITHEVAINRDWKLEAEPKDSVRDEIISSISRDLQAGLDAGLGDILPTMAEMIRDRLLSLLTPGNSLYKLISEALDIELITQEVKQGRFEYKKFFALLENILPQLCAPVRDPMVNALSTNPSENPIEQLARLFYVIDIIRLDMLNFSLQRLVPTLLREAAGYEKRQFAAELDGRFPDRTLYWWKQATMNANQDGSSQVSSNRIYMTGLVGLTTGTTPLERDNVPETLLLDLDRLNGFRRSNFRVILIASILSIAKNLLRRDVRTIWKSEAQQMWDLPFSSSPAAFISIVESRYALPPKTKQQLTGVISRLLLDARDGQVTHPVTQVLAKKVKAHVLARLSAASSEERVRVTTAATEVLGAGGLPEFVARINEMIAELERVAFVDHESHGTWYEMVAARAIEEGASESFA